MTDQEKRILWLKHIKGYRASKLTAIAWSEQNNVKVHMLRKWITRFNKENEISFKSKEWLPIEISNDVKETVKEISSSGIKINIGAASIEISSEFNTQTLKTVLEILSRTC